MKFNGIRHVKELIMKSTRLLMGFFMEMPEVDSIVIRAQRYLHRITSCYPYAYCRIKNKKAKDKYCVVRFSRPQFEMFAAGIQYIFAYYELMGRGYIPVIDMEYEYSYKHGVIGEFNIWDSCFQQTVTAKDANKGEFIVMTGDIFPDLYSKKLCKKINGDKFDHWVHLYKDNYKEYYRNVNKYIQPIWNIKKEIICELDEEIGNETTGKRGIGVFFREDFTNEVEYTGVRDEEVLNRHPLLPCVSEVVKIIEDKLSQWKCDYIFISTQYVETVEYIKELFPRKKVICIERERKHIWAKENAWDIEEKEKYEIAKMNREKDVERAQSYIKEIVALSKCSYLLGGASSGMLAALILNAGRYNDICILEDKRKITRY